LIWAAILLFFILGGSAFVRRGTSRKAASPCAPAKQPGPGLCLNEEIQKRCALSKARTTQRLAPGLPRLDIPGAELSESLSAFLELFSRRNKGASYLVATGKGPLSVELVLADNGPDLTDQERSAFFASGSEVLRAREGLDARLHGAFAFLEGLGGRIEVESRVEGGMCLRCRLPRSLEVRA
jgi:hypothetical protein